MSIADLYKINKYAAIKWIYSNNSSTSTIPTEKSVYDMFSKLSTKADPIKWENSPHITKATTNFNFECPTPNDIMAVLKKAKQKKSCPGPDKISYKELAMADPECKIMHKIFGLILQYGYIPKNGK